jgi:hypothetical protein
MKASSVSFEQMRRAARNNSDLGVPASYLQVEYGLAELEACWDGFVHTSDHYEQQFKTRKAIYEEFASAITDYIEYLGESIFIEVG